MADKPSAFKTDYAAMEAYRGHIKSAYLLDSKGPMGISAHTFLLFETDKGELLLSRGGATFEPREENFGRVMGWSKTSDGYNSISHQINRASNWLQGKTTDKNPPFALSPYDFGPMAMTTAPLQEIAYRDNDKRSSAEDKATTGLDIVNFKELKQGVGLDGITLRPNVTLNRIGISTDGNAIYDSALEANRMFDKLNLPYNPTPRGVLANGVNSHTATTTTLAIASRKTGGDLLGSYAANGYAWSHPGSPTNSVFTGPTLEKLQQAEASGVDLQWKSEDPSKTRIPTEWLMPYSGGPYQPMQQAKNDPTLPSPPISGPNHRAAGPGALAL